MHLGTAMEYVGGGDMFEYIHKRGGLPESSARLATNISNSYLSLYSIEVSKLCTTENDRHKACR